MILIDEGGMPMKTIAVLFLFLLFVSPPSSRTAIRQIKPSPKSDRDSRGLLGPVQTIRYDWCTLSGESGEDKETKWNYVQTLTFDLSGKIIVQDPPPYVCATSRLIEAGQKHNRKYDENGNEVEDIVTDLEGRVIHKVIQAFDSAGNRTELAYYYADGILDFKWLRKFDENGNEVETMRYGKGGIFQFREVRAFNERGQCIEYYRYKPDGSLDVTRREEFDYDSYGNWLRSTEYELVTKDGNDFFKPERIDRRFIVYHSDPPGSPGQ
jgi:hypothetical protein